MFTKLWVAWALALSLSPVCAQYLYTTENGQITIDEYVGPGGAVTVPATMDGLAVTRIGASAFQETHVTSVSIPATVVEIGDLAFACCASLTSISVDSINPAFSADAGTLFNKNKSVLIQYPAGKGGTFSIPNSVTRIGMGAFAGSRGVAAVSIPDSVTTIGDFAFYDCTSMTAAALPANLESIGRDAFAFCASLTNVVVPNGVTRIEENTYLYCESLTSVTLGQGLVSVGIWAFGGCSNLANVALPDGLNEIEAYAFNGCAKLSNVMAPASVTSIGDFAFSGCTNLTRVEIGSGLAQMGSYAFANNPNLQGVYMQGDCPSAGYDGFAETPATIYYLPSQTGWGATWAGRPTAVWLAHAMTSDGSFGVKSNRFEFKIAGPAGSTISVDASSDLNANDWAPLQTITLGSGPASFSDAQWTNHPTRIYRVRPL